MNKEKYNTKFEDKKFSYPSKSTNEQSSFEKPPALGANLVVTDMKDTHGRAIESSREAKASRRTYH